LVFSSSIFLTFFLPCVLLGYFTIGRKFRFHYLFAASIIFYSWGDIHLLWVILLSSTVDYFCGLGLGEKPDKTLYRNKLYLWTSLISNLSLLLYFKYAYFFAEIFQASTEFSFFNLEALGKISLPLGISFYTFQSMSYTIDVFRGLVKPTKSFVKFAGFVTLFPQLIAGPIVRYQDIQTQMGVFHFDLDQTFEGAKRFIFGLSKKVLIANPMGTVCDIVFSVPSSEVTLESAWIGVITYSLQIYFDFSGYSDMAIGLGKILGFQFPENFNYPYISKSITEFWRRWHISLSSWWRDYLYIPLGGNRHGPFRSYFNLMIVFVLCGLWHGASWNFLLWGVYYGIFLIIERLGFKRQLARISPVFSHFYTLIVVAYGWLLFRTTSVDQFSAFSKALVGFGCKGATCAKSNISYMVWNYEFLTALASAILLCMPVYSYLKKKTSSRNQIQQVFTFAWIVTLLVFSMAYVSGDTYNPFIYFRF